MYKIMYKKLINKKLAFKCSNKWLALVLFFPLSVIAETCDMNSSVLKANYTIETLHAGNDEEYKARKGSNLSLALIRNNTQVAYNYSNKNVIDTWVKYPNNKVALNRYFEQQKRSIEYQPTELKSKVNWQKQYQLITEKQIKDMTLITTAGSGCYQQEEYNLTQGYTNVRLTWLPQLNLVKRLQVSQKAHRKVWQLTDVESSEHEVKAFFAQRYKYQSTDYSDIGDNESDPFLVKMINLGFIEHTPQGFYNSQGDNISPSNHNHNKRH